MTDLDLFKLSAEEIMSDEWALAREMCDRYGFNVYEIANELARFRMQRADVRAKSLREEAAKLPPEVPPPPAILTHWNRVKHYWDARQQRWTKPGIVYIGRAMPHLNIQLPASPFGNPFRIEKDTDQMREDAIELYAEWITQPAQAHLLDQLESLRGQILVCWCYPRRCHGEVLIQLLRERSAHAAPQLQGEATTAEIETGAAAPQGSPVRGPAALDGPSEPHLVATESQR